MSESLGFIISVTTDAAEAAAQVVEAGQTVESVQQRLASVADSIASKNPLASLAENLRTSAADIESLTAKFNALDEALARASRSGTTGALLVNNPQLGSLGSLEEVRTKLEAVKGLFADLQVPANAIVEAQRLATLQEQARQGEALGSTLFPPSTQDQLENLTRQLTALFASKDIVVAQDINKIADSLGVARGQAQLLADELVKVGTAEEAAGAGAGAGAGAAAGGSNPIQDIAQAKQLRSDVADRKFNALQPGDNQNQIDLLQAAALEAGVAADKAAGSLDNLNSSARIFAEVAALGAGETDKLRSAILRTYTANQQLNESQSLGVDKITAANLQRNLLNAGLAETAVRAAEAAAAQKEEAAAAADAAIAGVAAQAGAGTLSTEPLNPTALRARAAALRNQAVQQDLAAATTQVDAGTLSPNDSSFLRLNAAAESTALKFQQLAESARLASTQEERLALIQELVEGASSKEAIAILALSKAQLDYNDALAAGAKQQTIYSAAANELRATNNLNAIRDKQTQAEAAAAGGGGGFFSGIGEGLTSGGGAGGTNGIGQQLGFFGSFFLVSEALRLITDGLKGTIEQTKLYQNGLISLQVALQSVGAQGAVSAGDLTQFAQAAGAGPGDALQAAARGVQAFSEDISKGASAQAVAITSTQAAFDGAILTGEKYNAVQGQIIATAREFDLGFQGQNRVLDAATNANKNFGASIKDVLDGLAQTSGLAREAGFSPEALANAIGLISSSTDLTGSSAAGDLKRILGGGGSPQFQKAIEQAGVNTNQSVAGELDDLAKKFKTLDQAQQQQIITTLGGRRSAEALLPLLESYSRLADANAKSVAGAGASADRTALSQDTLAGTFRQLGGAVKSLETDVGESGLGSGLGLLVKTFTPLIELVDEAFKVFDKLPSPLRNAALAIGELTAAIFLLQRTSLGGIAGSLGGLATSIATRFAGAGAAEAATAGETAAVVGLPGIGAAAATDTAALGTGALVGGAVATAGIVAAAAGVVLLGSKAVDLNNSLNGAGDAIANLTTGPASVNTLSDDIANLSTALAKVNNNSSGALGGLVNFIEGDPAATRRQQLQDQINLDKAQRDALAQVADNQTNVGPQSESGAIFGAQGPQTLDAFNLGLKDLTTSGDSATHILSILSATIDTLTGTGQAAAARFAPGAIAVTGGALQFATTVGANTGFQNIGLPLDAGAIASDAGVQIDHTINAAAQRDFFNGQQDANGLNTFKLSAAKQGVLSTSIQDSLKSLGASGDGAILTTQEQQQIANEAIARLNLPASLNQIKQSLADALVKELAKAGGDASTQVKAFKTDPGIVAAVTDAAIKAASQSASDIQALHQGDDAKVKDAENSLQVLSKIANDSRTAGVVLPDNLINGIEKARVDLVDAYVAKVKNLLDIAEKALPANDAKGKKALEAEAANIETLANQAGSADGLGQGFTTLSQARRNLTNAALTSSNDVVQKAAADLTAAKADAAALDAEAQHLLEVAAAAFNAADTTPFGNSIASDKAGIAANQAAIAARNQAAAGIAKSKSEFQVGQAGLLAPVDQQLQDSINQLGAAGSQPANTPSAASATKAIERAGAIAAAQQLANAFPGDAISEDRAKIAAAQDDLNAAQQAGDQLKYFQALKSLRDAEHKLADDILTAQHIQDELHIDLTNPVAVAREAVLEAQRKLNSDRSAGAPTDVLNVDTLAVRQAQTKQQSDLFNQQISQLQTNKDLERITQAQYISYLDSQQHHLVAIQHRTFQQQSELDQVDKLLQEAAKQLQGQFNLGQIGLPSIFQVRQALQGGAGAQVASVQNVNVTVNGGDLNQVKQVLSQFLGQSAFARTGVSTAKV